MQNREHPNIIGTAIRQPPRDFALLEVDSKLLFNLIKIKINLTGTVRVQYNINAVFGKPFNRTSLELKRVALECY